jgi:condensation domain-containing protein
MMPAKAVTLTFRGHRARNGPLSWGQRWMWDALADLGTGDRRLNMQLVVPLPERPAAGQAMAALAALAGRHEMLRTRFTCAPDTGPAQHVDGSGQFTVGVREAGGSPIAETAERFAAELASGRFELADEYPVRFGLVTTAGRCGAVAVAAAQLGFDGWSMTVLQDEIRALAQAGDSAGADTPAGEVRQPLDQAAYERSGAGVAAATAAAGYWREHLELAKDIAPPRLRPGGEDPRFWRAAFRSPDLGSACARVAQQHRVMPAAALLTGLCVMLGHRLGQTACAPQVMFHNRFHPSARQTLAHLAQGVPVMVDLADGTVAGLAQRISRRMMRASRAAAFDPLQIGPMMHGPGPHRGTHRGYPIVFNLERRTETSLLAATPARGDGGVAAAGSSFCWVETVDEENLGCYINVYDPDQGDLMFWIDTRYLGRADLASVAFGTERLMRLMASGVDVGLAEVGAVTDVLPAPDLPVTAAPAGTEGRA